MELPERKSPRLKNFDYASPHIYFITTNTYNKNPYFIRRDFNTRVIKCLEEERNIFEIKVFVYCLMPDHVHVLIQPYGIGANVSDFIGSFKGSITALKRSYGMKGKLWQQRFYDHILRKDKDVVEIAKYILNNPVRRKMVESWEEYEFCGYLDEFD